MNKTEAQREEELFDAARKLADPAATRAFLDRSCAGDPAQRTRIERLLAAESDADRFFAESSSALGLSPGGKAGMRSRTATGGGDSANLPGEEPLGSRIGRYKLLEKIGEGGCGIVYLAGQDEPVCREVALKIIKLGMETRSVIARFEAERQALAMMDHPNIAKVFDAGATDRGPPYFVMELVRGVKITEYCDRNQVGIGARLELLIQVCHAIQHAHQKGIIHGDIKPSNIMVTLHDGLPLPKVIDFGIARATEARLSDKLLFTAYAQLIGTPAYMSPEQADMNDQGIDTRSDIYSLGVLLYELLTGRTPFEAKELLESGIDEMRRTLREREPPRPSARVTALRRDERGLTALQRRTEPGKLASLLHGDLDWIVMKALEKDRGRRYETANGLAMDLQRHLDHEPVMAGPPSRLYRFRKLVRRNRVVFAAGGAVAAALVLGLGTSTWLLLREREARQRAVAAEQQQARLRHEAEIRERITQTALLVSQEKLDEADRQLDGVVLTQPTVEGAAVLRFVGEWHAFHQRWKQAAGRLGLLVRVNQLDGWDVSSLDSLRCGPMLIEGGETGDYARFREEEIIRFAGTPCPFPDRVLKISLLQPADRRIVELLGPLAEGTMKSFQEADAAGDAFQAAWRAVALALWEYRRGDFSKAAEWSQRCLAYPEANVPRSATARVILALSCHQAGRPEEARAVLGGVEEIVEGKFKGRMDLGSPIQGFWFDWCFVRILLREAEADLAK